MKIERKLTVDVDLTPKDIADCFCELYADEQAVFFNRISELVEKWDTSFNFQLQAIGNGRVLTNDGRRIMSMIGDYLPVI